MLTGLVPISNGTYFMTHPPHSIWTGVCVSCAVLATRGSGVCRADAAPRHRLVQRACADVAPPGGDHARHGRLRAQVGQPATRGGTATNVAQVSGDKQCAGDISHLLEKVMEFQVLRSTTGLLSVLTFDFIIATHCSYMQSFKGSTCCGMLP